MYVASTRVVKGKTKFKPTFKSPRRPGAISRQSTAAPSEPASTSIAPPTIDEWSVINDVLLDRGTQHIGEEPVSAPSPVTVLPPSRQAISGSGTIAITRPPIQGRDQDEQYDEETSSSTTTRKSSRRGPNSKPKTTRKSRRLELENAEAAEKEHDPTQTSMSALVQDLPVGRSTPNRLDKVRKLRESRARDRVLRSKLKESDKRISLGLPKEGIEQDPADQVPAIPRIERGIREDGIDETNQGSGSLDTDTAGNDDDWLSGLKDSAFVPQIRLDDAGNIVTDDLRMEIDRDASVHEEDYEHITERESDRFVNSMTHSKKNRGGSRWGKDETAMFFHYLAMYGTDFEAIARLMTFRTRAEIRRKFNAEDKRNPALVTDCLLYRRVPIDIEEHGRITGKDLSGPPPEIRRPLARLVENEAGAEGEEGRDNPGNLHAADGGGRGSVGLFLDSPQDQNLDEMDIEDEPDPGRIERSPSPLSADALVDSFKSSVSRTPLL